MNIHFRCRGLLVLLAVLFGIGAVANAYDPTPSGKPIREEIPDGGHKEIYKNKAGERVQEDTFDALGQKKSSKFILDRHPNGREKQTQTNFYEQKGGQMVESRTETFEYDNKGKTTLHKDETIDRDANGNVKKRTITTYDPATDEPTEREIIDANGKKTHKVWDPEKKKWKTVKPEKKESGADERGDSSFEQPADSAVYFRAGEVQVRAFAVFAAGNAQKTVTHKVKETRTVVRDVTVEETELVDDPNVGAFVPVTKEVVVPTEFRETVTREEKETIGPYHDHAFGFGMDAKYFVNRTVGIGVEGDWLSADHDAWSVFATVTARCPIEGSWHVAPYLAAGIGGQFADDDRLVGMVALGVEKRFNPTCGTFFEGRYLFDGDQQNVFELRVGVSFAFGPGKETTGQTVIPGGTHSEAWSSINPLAKPLRY
jgi:hypothetical protein